MRVHGVLLVRDGAATLRASLLHHVGLGCERIHVVDDGSTDDTPVILRRLQRRLPLEWRRREGDAFQQHEVTTELVHDATRAGADWVLVFDHDEFWVSRRPLIEVLADADAARAAAIRGTVVNFVQRRHVRASSAAALLTMDHRPERLVPPEEAEPLVEAGALSFLEYAYPPKLIFRASTRVHVARGAHWSPNLEGTVVDGDGVEVLHAPLPARDALQRKAEAGERTLRGDFIHKENWHMRRWAQLARAGRLDEEWPALSVDEEGTLSVGGRRHACLHDPRLSEAVRPYVRSRPSQLAARVAGRSF